MENVIKEEEIDGIVEKVLKDFNGGKNIDAMDIFSKPDKSEVRDMIRNLFRIIFPGYFRERTFKIYNPRNSIAVTVEDIFYHLNKQVFLALDFCTKRGTLTEDERRAESYRICRVFFDKIPAIREYIETDLLAAYDGDPAAGCFEEVILAYPGLMAVTVYRIAHELHLLGVPLIPRMMTEYAHSTTGIDIHPGATIGRHFFIDHGTGVVIGETTIIGENVKLYQGVTLGGLSTRGGQALKGKRRHPTIGDNVTIYSGASILGGETVIGKDAVIGGNAFITTSIPDGARISIRNQELKFHYDSDDAARIESRDFNDNGWFYVI